MNDKPLIDTPNLPTWTVGAFVLALLALVIAFASLYRTNIVAVGTQAEVLMLIAPDRGDEVRRGGTAAGGARSTGRTRGHEMIIRRELAR